MLVILTAILSLCIFKGDAKVVEDIKLFDVVNLIGVVNETTGFHSNSKAYEFTGTTGDLVAGSNVSAQFAKEAQLVKQFTVKAYLLPAAGSAGGTVVFFSRGSQRGAAFYVKFTWNSNTDLEVGSVFYIRDSSSPYSCSFDKVRELKRDRWLHLEVRVQIQERLIRCKISQGGRVFFRFAGLSKSNYPFDPFPHDGRLRLAQQFLPENEHIQVIRDRFVGKLQDVVISFGDPNCTVTIVDDYMATTSTTPTCPTTNSAAKDDTCRDADGKTRTDGETWKEKDWVDCTCNKGKTYCIRSGQRCVYKGENYREGQTWDDSTTCDYCKCVDGIAKCKGTVRKRQELGCNWDCNSSDNCPHVETSGCFCPDKKIFQNGKCLDRLTCPCVHDGKTYKPGSVRIGCDLCVCSKGTFSRCYYGVFC